MKISLVGIIMVNFFYDDAEYEEMMEMDSPFQQKIHIEDENSRVFKRGQTITLTCRINPGNVFTKNESTSSQKAIEWMKNGELLRLEVSVCYIFLFRDIFEFRRRKT